MAEASPTLPHAHGSVVLTVPMKSKEQEEEEERTANNKVDIRSFLCVAMVALLGETSRGLVVSLLWGYIQNLHGSLKVLSIAASAFSFARFFAAPFFGHMANTRSHRSVMIWCLSFLIVGNILFAIYPPTWLLIISRLVVGIGAGSLGQSRGYVAQVTTKKQRTAYMGYLTISQFAGYAVTPGLTMILYYVDFDVARFEVDIYSSAGFLLAMLSAIALSFVMLGFREPARIQQQHIPTPVRMVELEDKEDTSKREEEGFVGKNSKEEEGEEEEEEEMEHERNAVRSRVSWARCWDPSKAYYEISTVSCKAKKFAENPHWKHILLFSGLIFATRGGVAVIETINSTLLQDYYGWGSVHTGLVLCVLGVIGSTLLFFLPRLARRVGEGTLLIVGVASLALGLLLIMPWGAAQTNKIQFLIGLGFTWSIGSALCQTLITSFLSRILGSRPQSDIMGWLASLGSVARVVGALWVGAFSISTAHGVNIVVGVAAFLMVACLMFSVRLVVSRKLVGDL